MPAAIIERDDGALIEVVDKSLGRTVLPTDLEELPKYLADFKDRSNELMDAISHELAGSFTISGLDKFRGFAAMPLRGSPMGLIPTIRDARIQFLRPWSQGANEFLLVTGDASHFVMEQPTISACVGRDWVDCNEIGEQMGASPILGPSVDPKAYYASATSHHCAHRGIHDRRSSKCYVAVFEKFLCCKACIFQERCWPEPLAPQGCSTLFIGSAGQRERGVLGDG